jgi:hypothetical protein
MYNVPSVTPAEASGHQASGPRRPSPAKHAYPSLIVLHLGESDSPRMRTVRLVVGYGAIACALPYLALKVVWLSGGTLGAANPNIMRDGSMMALNAITAFMDLTGIGLALAFTHSWGLRVPAWLLLPPMWVATGLLSRFVLWVPMVAAIRVMNSESLPRVTGGPVEPWVYVLVYIEFAGLGVGLIAGFILHARARWPEAFRPAAGAVPPGPAYAVLRPLAATTAILATAASLLHLAWAFGFPVGLTGAEGNTRTLAGSLIHAIDAGMMLAAAAGVLMMVHRLAGNAPFWLALSLTWVGAGSLFGWGLWTLINVLAQTALLRDAPGQTLVNLTHLLSLLLGLTMGVILLVVVAERRDPAAHRP